MSATASSLQKTKSSLGLREKILELHDAVKELQQRDVSPSAADDTYRITAVESQISLLKKAIGTLADAVTDEFETMRQQVTTSIDLVK